jgi:pyroglutamyl-peptidase
MYAVAHLLAREYPAARSGFIHIPFLPEQVTDKPGQPSMAAELSLRAVTAAIEVLTR